MPTDSQLIFAKRPVSAVLISFDRVLKRSAEWLLCGGESAGEERGAALLDSYILAGDVEV
jgi:hypothetical protein